MVLGSVRVPLCSYARCGRPYDVLLSNWLLPRLRRAGLAVGEHFRDPGLALQQGAADLICHGKSKESHLLAATLELHAMNVFILWAVHLSLKAEQAVPTCGHSLVGWQC